MKPVEEQSKDWADVPEYIKRTFDRLGIPEAEKRFLGGNPIGANRCLCGDGRPGTDRGRSDRLPEVLGTGSRYAQGENADPAQAGGG